MFKKIGFVLAMAACTYVGKAQEKRLFTETTQQKIDRMSWWTNDRFGMFIHWGLYSLPARHEWVKNAERLTNEQYQPYFDNFNPDLYNPREWARKAKAAGMKYAVLTTKHHEGFCLFDSKYTDYKSTNTKYGKDLVQEWLAAFRAEGIKVGFYYSLIDWHHPDFTIDKMHPQRLIKQTNEGYAKLNEGKDWNRYKKYLHDQIKELMQNYGKIDILWLDFSYPGEFGKGKDDWGSIDLLKMVRKLQPGILVDNRLDLAEYVDGQDFITPEQSKPDKLPMGTDAMPFETCQTFSGSWGYHRDENSWKSNYDLLNLLITSVSKNGNLLLNVGPTARGIFDYRADRALDSLGIWMSVNSRSIYGCKNAPDSFKMPENTRLTYNPNTKKLYIHLMQYPSNGRLVLPGYKGKVSYMQFLHDASEIREDKKEASSGADLIILVPEHKPTIQIPVIEVTLKD
ncbi:alpha-L-fucosidase [Pedobacter sp. MW01-1-1]|uniref:alpha-L-fucosidase n=1 Tax=Pedobacter sp. MW01-1-1 TaxID=3383027 RepID=UPI003FF05D53